MLFLLLQFQESFHYFHFIATHSIYERVYSHNVNHAARCVCDERSRIYMLPVCGEIPNEMLSLRAKRLAGIRMTNKMEKMLRHV